jgi:hypothetical protein
MPRKRKYNADWKTCIACKKPVANTDASWSQHIRFNPTCGKVTMQMDSNKNKKTTTEQKNTQCISNLKPPPNQVASEKEKVQSDRDKVHDNNLVDNSDCAFLPDQQEEIITYQSKFASLPEYCVPTNEDSTSESEYSLEPKFFEEEDSKPPDTSTVDDSNVTLFEKQQEQKQQTHVNDIHFPIGKDTNHSIELMHLCKQARDPLYMFDGIQKWARDTIRDDPTYFEGPSIKRQNVLNSLNERYCLEGYEPTVHNIGLPSGKLIDVVIHDFDAAIFSLLSDPYLMQEENLLLNLDEPWKPLSHPENEIGDIHTGSLFKDGWKLYCRQNSNDVLCALMFFIDKTFTDVGGNLNIEGVTFTLTIFNQKTRNTTRAMRQIGYISNQKLLRYATPEEKSRDYHAILAFILTKIYDHQSSKDGMLFELDLKQKKHKITLQMPVMVFMGDNEGLDKLCYRYLNKTNVARLCRNCNGVIKEMDWPFMNHQKYVTQKSIEELFDNGKVNQLHEICHYNLQNATWKLKFCDPVRGIYGSTPFDLVHAWQQGWYGYFTGAFYSQKSKGWCCCCQKRIN